MGEREIKRKLFAQGTAAAQAARIKAAGYICPLCLESFGIGALDNGQLTLEHVPQRSQGGRGIILTCKTCNNTAGHALESHTHLRDKQDAFVKGLVGEQVGLGGQAVAIFGDFKVNIEVIREDGVTKIKVSKQNDPAAIEGGKAFFERGMKGDNRKNLKFKVTSRDVYNLRRAHAADLKAAFLTLTAAFGYCYAMDDVSRPVLEQIANPESKILPKWWGNIQIDPNSIVIIEPEGAAVVSFSERAVVLPWPSRQDNRWAELLVKQPRTISGLRWNWPKEFEAYLDHLTRES